ncbi:MAG TPA: lamin tail domain-containing protein [Polyangia bacterium]
MRVCLVMWIAGCSPNIDLAAERRAPGPASDGGTAGRTESPLGLPELVDPPPGIGQVPPNLAKVILRLLEPLQVPETTAPLTLSASDGSEVQLALTGPVACAGNGTCYATSPSAVLVPTTLYTVKVAAEALHFVSGKPVPAGTIGSFTTATASDDYAPLVSGFTLSLAEGCVHAQLVTDEAAWAAIVISAGDRVSDWPMDHIASKFDILSRLPNLPEAVDAQAVARVLDRAGNRSDSPAVALHFPPRLPRLVITEVLGNPAGSEYTQEFAEIKNLEPEPVSLAGMRFEDKSGSDTLPDLSVPAGGFALLVAEGFILDDGKDPVPRDGTVIVRVSGRLGADGFSNSGEQARLVSEEGAVVSQYGGWVDTSATAWNGMSVHRLSVDACDQPSAWTNTPEAPTPGW